jgi:hypothetical protein
MEKKEATKVGCQSCKTNKGVIKVQRFLYGFGIFMFVFSLYGIYSFVKDIISLF